MGKSLVIGKYIWTEEGDKVFEHSPYNQTAFELQRKSIEECKGYLKVIGREFKEFDTIEEAKLFIEKNKI